MSEPIQSIAQNNYILSNDRPDTMYTSGLEYDGDKISGYAGSAFKAGDEFPQSATEAIEVITGTSATWNGTTDTVSSNSGAWGGAGIQISAGSGIKVDLVNNTLVFSKDETVLWEGTPTNSNIECSEALSNFEQVILYGKWNYNSSQAIYAETTIPGSAGTVQVGGLGLNTKTTTPTDFFCTYVDYSISEKNLTSNAKLRIQIRTGQNSSTSDTILIYKIVGINRISGDN